MFFCIYKISEDDYSVFVRENVNIGPQGLKDIIVKITAEEIGQLLGGN